MKGGRGFVIFFFCCCCCFCLLPASNLPVKFWIYFHQAMFESNTIISDSGILNHFRNYMREKKRDSEQDR